MPARNDPCPCGSGRRYKHCHGAQGAAEQSPATAQQSPAPAQRDAEPAAVASLRARARLAIGDEQSWMQLLDLLPDDPEALFMSGNLARHRGDLDRAAAQFEKAIAVDPSHVAPINNLGLVYEGLGRLDDAEAMFRRLVAAHPTALEPLANLAQALFRRNRQRDALEYFDRVVLHHAAVRDASMHANRATCLIAVGRPADADAALATAIALAPSPELMRTRAVLLCSHGRFADAAPLLDELAEVFPGDMHVASLLAHCRANLADWRDAGALARRVEGALRAAQPGAAPVTIAFDVLAQSDDLVVQRAAAAAWSPAPAQVPRRPAFDRHKERLHLGFVASEFCNQPVPRLLLGLLDNLGRGDFEISTIATAPRRFDDAILARARARADHHLELAGEGSPSDAAARVRALGVDVLFDLNGLTGTPSTALFAQRTAPMQVNYLGYTGTMGGAAHDYIIADDYCIPQAAEAHYAERVLRLGGCYLPSDPLRGISTPPLDRARYGLPPDAFVLAAFPAMLKIHPPLFDAWMRLMRAHPRAVLWLRSAQPAAAANLRGNAQARGVDGARLVFAPVDDTSVYLARFALADLFLDTWPYGSHTNVNDALFAGLPAVTLAGRSFAARASASQLIAVGLLELVAQDFEQYERIAAELIDNPARLAALRAHLRSNEARAPLFDMQRYAADFTQVIRDGWRSLDRPTDAPPLPA